MTDYDYYRKKIETAKQSQGKAVYGIASGSAAAAMIPVPGLDIAVDITSMIAFARSCLTQFGLTEEALQAASEHIAYHAMKKSGSLAAKQAGKKLLQKAVVKECVDKAIAIAKRKVYKFLEKAGIMAIVKKFAAQKGGASVAKYIPFVGSAVAGGLAFYCTQSALNEILDEMYETAKEIYLE